MNDTEQRLRDYLRAKADTVPDDAESPGLEEHPAPRRRVWPALVAAAVIGAVLVLTGPVLTRLADDEQHAAGPRAPLDVPYILSDAASRVLHDRDRKVSLPESILTVAGRVAGGWAVTFMERGSDGSSRARVAVLTPQGALRPIGPAKSNYVVISPDRTQLATTEPLGDGRTRTSVYDVASGRAVAGRIFAHRTTVLWGWNVNGIWLAEDFKVGVQPSVWQPATGRLTPLTIPGFQLGLTVARDTDRVLAVTQPQERRWCLRAGRLQAGRFVLDRELCGPGGKAIYPALAPRGRTMIYPDAALAVDVATGRQTPLRYSGSATQGPVRPVFENPEQVLVTVPLPNGSPSSSLPRRLFERKEVYRCAVASGACEKALTTPDATTISLLEP